MAPIVIGPIPTHRLEQLETLLREDLSPQMLALGLLKTHGPSSFLACVEDGEVQGVAYVGADGLVVPAAIRGRRPAISLGKALRKHRVRRIVGEHLAVAGLLTGLGVEPVSSHGQRLHSATADDMGPYVTPALRQATLDDLPVLLEAGETYHEEMKEPPPAEGLMSLIRGRVERGQTWVMEREGEVGFRVDVSYESRFGAHLHYIYTLPDHRQQGLATRGLGQLCRTVLARLPRLTAMAPQGSEGAAALVRNVGFVPGVLWKRVEMPEPRSTVEVAPDSPDPEATAPPA